jgi:hypothetical protein
MGVKPTVVSIKKHQTVVKALAQEYERVKLQKLEIAVLSARLAELDKPSGIRPELSWFVAQCEASLAYHDPVKGDSYKKKQKEPEFFGYQIAGKMQNLMAALCGRSWEKKNGNIISLAVGIANLSMMMAYNAAVEEGIVIEPPY